MIDTLHLPEIATETREGHQATFVLEPLQNGFGVTIGNALRRVLLSSLPGAAVTGFKAEGVDHEFSTIKGVKEDVIEIILNMKELRFQVYSDQPQMVKLVKKGQGPVTGADIETTADVEVVNPDHHIATLDNKTTELDMQLRVEKGRGYVAVEDREDEELEVGMIGVDTLFSPIRRVRYNVDHTRVGQVTDLDKLTIEITTDGTIDPEEALKQAAAILVEQFGIISGDTTTVAAPETEEEESEPAELNFSVDDLSLSSRTTNALKNNDVNTVRELLKLSDSEMKELKGFGAKAFEETTDKLEELELR